MANLAPLKIIASVIVLGTTVSPAMADRWDNHHRDRDRDGVPDRVERKIYNNQIKNARRYGTPYPTHWNDQRSYFSQNWSRRNNNYSRAQREALEAQMRAQWNAYNPNYRGPYSWNQYNNPQFLDYVHTRNPGLFTNLRTYLGI